MEGKAEGSLFDSVDDELLGWNEGGDESESPVGFELLIRDGYSGDCRLGGYVAASHCLFSSYMYIFRI